MGLQKTLDSTRPQPNATEPRLQFLGSLGGWVAGLSLKENLTQLNKTPHNQLQLVFLGLEIFC